MTNLLIDTQVLIWIQIDADRISPVARLLLTDPTIVKWVSEVSLFGIAIKKKIGKLDEFMLPLAEYVEQIENANIKLLPITNRHIIAYDRIPLINDHRDPFDRLILATALHEGWPILSSDHTFSWYPDLVEVIW